MIDKLMKWDLQLEEAQNLVEKQITECNQNIGSNYERQFKLEIELRQKREQMLKQMADGNKGIDDEMMGESGLMMGGSGRGNKKKGDDGWMSSIKGGFFNNKR